jgi:hypothetical protein
MQTDPSHARRTGPRRLRVITASIGAAAAVGTGALAWSVAAHDSTTTAASDGSTTSTSGGQFSSSSSLPQSSTSGSANASSGGS